MKLPVKFQWGCAAAVPLPLPLPLPPRPRLPSSPACLSACKLNAIDIAVAALELEFNYNRAPTPSSAALLAALRRRQRILHAYCVLRGETELPSKLSLQEGVSPATPPDQSQTAAAELELNAQPIATESGALPADQQPGPASASSAGPTGKEESRWVTKYCAQLETVTAEDPSGQQFSSQYSLSSAGTTDADCITFLQCFQMPERYDADGGACNSVVLSLFRCVSTALIARFSLLIVR